MYQMAQPAHNKGRKIAILTATATINCKSLRRQQQTISHRLVYLQVDHQLDPRMGTDFTEGNQLIKNKTKAEGPKGRSTEGPKYRRPKDRKVERSIAKTRLNIFFYSGESNGSVRNPAVTFC